MPADSINRSSKPHTVRPVARLEDHGGFQEGGCRCPAHSRCGDRLGERVAVRLVLQNRKESRCVDDHQRGRPCSSYARISSAGRPSCTGSFAHRRPSSSSSSASVRPELFSSKSFQMVPNGVGDRLGLRLSGQQRQLDGQLLCFSVSDIERHDYMYSMTTTRVASNVTLRGVSQFVPGRVCGLLGHPRSRHGTLSTGKCPVKWWGIAPLQSSSPA